MSEEERWVVNTLEVIINHYKELEDEEILRNRVLSNAVKQEAE